MKVWKIFFNRSDRPHDQSMILGGTGPGFEGTKEVVSKEDILTAVTELESLQYDNPNDRLACYNKGVLDCINRLKAVINETTL